MLWLGSAARSELARSEMQRLLIDCGHCDVPGCQHLEKAAVSTALWGSFSSIGPFSCASPLFSPHIWMLSDVFTV